MARIAIDVGGTFTDVLHLDDAGELQEFKVPTTPTDPSTGVVKGLEKAAAGVGTSVGEFMKTVDILIHGTTLATNALLTGRGAKVGMITTKNFRDLVEIRRGFKNVRTSMYNVFVPPYSPLAPRFLRFGVEERTLHTGEIVTPLNMAELKKAVNKLRGHGVESVAVCFLHSYVNPENEQTAANYCKQSLEGVYVTASHEILPVWREFERFSTTLVGAYIGPIVNNYLRTLEKRLADIGFRGMLLLVQSEGLVQTVEESCRKAVALIGSGPAAGPATAVHWGQAINHNNVISMDMGGTSLDICLIRDGEIPTSTEAWVGEERVAVKMVDIHSAGAGGGSIAWIDSLGLLRIGPQSAGADPGPACYGKGGEEPTVTDADLVLGYIPADYFLGGEICLDDKIARRALNKVGERLGMGLTEIARGVFATVNSFMADQITEISTKRGHDLRDFALIAGGGAGGIHAASVAEILGIPIVVVPTFAALYSAFGMFAMNVGQSYARSYIARADRLDVEKVNKVFLDMQDEALEAFQRFGVGKKEDLQIIRSADVRYVGQFNEVEVGVLSGELKQKDLQDAVNAFHALHQRLYNFSIPSRPVEFHTFRIKGLALRAPFRTKEVRSGDADASGALKRKRSAFFDGSFVDTPVYEGEKLQRGNEIVGPAIIEEKTTTVVIPGSFVCAVDQFRNFVLRRRA